VRFAIITGEAEEYVDPNQELERRKFLRNMGHVLDLDAYFTLHETRVRAVFRVRVDPDRVASMDANKAVDPETGSMGTPSRRARPRSEQRGIRSSRVAVPR
jgi:hypothetical protein